MALSESDKKKLPLLAGILVLLAAYCGYEYIYVPMQLEKQEQATIAQRVKSEFEKSEAQKNEAAAPVQNLGVISSAHASEANGSSSQPIAVELQDANGNTVHAIKAPAPELVKNTRSFFLSDEDRRLIDLMRSNILLKAQIQNEELKQKKSMQIAQTVINQSGVTGNTGGVVPQNASDLTNFNEVETIQPTFLSAEMSQEEIDDAFSNVEVLSIADNGGIVTAYIKINGILTKAAKGKVIGDYEIQEVTPGYIAISYVPANITRKIGHSGFTYDKQQG